MKITYDSQADAMYLYLQPRKKVKKTQEVGANTIVDIAADGDIIGVEILGVKAQMSQRELVKLKSEIELALA